MGITMLKKKALRARDSERGFSLLEMVMVVALGIILTAIAFVSMIPMVQQQHVVNAYNTTMAAMRQARDNSISQRTSYSVTFTKTSSPALSTITVAPTLSTGFQDQQNSVTYQLPTDVQFDAEPAVASTATPDGFGTGATPIDFGYTASGTGTGAQTVIYFCPDGSSQDGTGGVGACTGNWSGGVVYIAMPGNLMSSRALSLWGATGRIHGWRLYSNSSGGYQWLRQ
jgi:type II secretory pathway pseudopilin PulG